MNWKAVLTGALGAIVAMIAYDMFIRKAIQSNLETYLDEDKEFDGHTLDKLAA